MSNEPASLQLTTDNPPPTPAETASDIAAESVKEGRLVTKKRTNPHDE